LRALTPRYKKLIGAVIIIVWVPVYALVAMRLGVAILPEANSLVALVYYVIAGTAWIIPIGLMLPWMSREPRG
jgi:Protein of unknown function (DUF2842)